MNTRHHCLICITLLILWSVSLAAEARLFEARLDFPAGNHAQSVAISDLDDDGILDLAVANYLDDNVSILLGTGDGSFADTVNYVAGDGHPDLALPNMDGDDVSILINTSGTLFADLTCTPSFGTLPFTTQMTVTLSNRYSGQTRRMAARIDITLANGTSVANWRRGYANIGAGSLYTTSWNQNIPLALSMVGNNVFSLEAGDVTPAPFNQPPYPPSGDIDLDLNVVTGLKP